jgi:hypothetical protein
MGERTGGNLEKMNWHKRKGVMSSRTAGLFTVLCVTLPGVVPAQTPGPRLTLQDAQAVALKNHPQVLASQANYLRADQIITEARSAYYPALNGSITGGQAQLNSRLGAGVINDPGLFNHFGSGIALSQLITDSGRTPNLVATAFRLKQASRITRQHDTTLFSLWIRPIMRFCSHRN